MVIVAIGNFPRTALRHTQKCGSHWRNFSIYLLKMTISVISAGNFSNGVYEKIYFESWRVIQYNWLQNNNAQLYFTIRVMRMMLPFFNLYSERLSMLKIEILHNDQNNSNCKFWLSKSNWYKLAILYYGDSAFESVHSESLSSIPLRNGS